MRNNNGFYTGIKEAGLQQGLKEVKNNVGKKILLA